MFEMKIHSLFYDSLQIYRSPSSWRSVAGHTHVNANGLSSSSRPNPVFAILRCLIVTFVTSPF